MPAHQSRHQTHQLSTNHQSSTSPPDDTNIPDGTNTPDGRQLTQSSPPCPVGHSLTDTGGAIWDKMGLFQFKRTHDPLFAPKHPLGVVLGGNNVPCVREIGRRAYLVKITAPESDNRVAGSPAPMESGFVAPTIRQHPIKQLSKTTARRSAVTVYWFRAEGDFLRLMVRERNGTIRRLEVVFACFKSLTELSNR